MHSPPKILSVIKLLKREVCVNVIRIVQYAAVGKSIPKKRKYRDIGHRIADLKQTTKPRRSHTISDCWHGFLTSPSRLITSVPVEICLYCLIDRDISYSCMYLSFFIGIIIINYYVSVLYCLLLAKQLKKYRHTQTLPEVNVLLFIRRLSNITLTPNIA